MNRIKHYLILALLAIAAAATGPARAQSTSSLVFEASCGGSGTADDNVQWTVTSDGTESNYDGTKGIHYGTGQVSVQYIELSTSGITGTITQVKVNASTASGVTATVGVTVGGNAFGGDPQSLSTTATNYTFTGSASGAIVVRVAKPSAAVKALYVKSIEVTYTPASSGGGSNRTIYGIPEGWTVTANGQSVTVSGDSAIVPEGAAVLLIPPLPAKPKVSNVTLVDASAPVVLTLDLATVTTDTTVEDGYTVTGTLGANVNVKISIADGATVTLDGVTINGVNHNSYNWAGINCLGDATIILSGTNTVKGFYEDYPGIYVPQNKTVTIQGSGSLTASSSGFGCGIGGGYEIAGGNIVIAGGTITANGGGGAAGIGGGSAASCGNISITGGTVNATGGNYGAGIGGSNNGSCGTISITGGNINATGDGGAAGIGGGNSGSCGNISITGGNINSTGGHFAAGIGGGYFGQCGTVTITNGVTSVTATKGNDASYSIGHGKGGSCGTVTVMGATGPRSESPYIYPLTLDLATVTTATTVGDGYTLTGTLGANVEISIADGATVTLDGVTINGVNDDSYNWAGITCLGDATIILSGTNTVKGFYQTYPGIYVPQNKTLTIEGSGSLTASSNGSSCGIGGGYEIAGGNIVIAGGTITATGGGSAAGIGGGHQTSCGTITITGGTVNANGGPNGAGIGSGYQGPCGNISITGGNITATGGQKGAGIGSGRSASCGNISITGGTVTANGGTQAAGIGGGNSGQCGTVTITNGVTSLTATKGNSATHSIGAGNSGSCGTVTVMGAVGEINQSPYTYPQN